MTIGYVRRFFGRPRPISSLRHALIQECYSALVAEGLAVDTHRNYLAQTKSYLKWLVETAGLLKSNPGEKVFGVGQRSEGKETLDMRPLRIWREEAYKRADSGDVGAIAALMALELGMRASEIVTRRVCDLDEYELPCDTVIIRKAAPPSESGPGFNPKTKKSRRRLGVPDELRPYLERLVAGKGSTEYLFPALTREGRKPTHRYRDWVRDNVIAICTAVDVPEVCAHALRGNYAEIGARLDPLGAQERLGHTDKRTTQKYSGKDALEAGARAQGIRLLQGGKK